MYTSRKSELPHLKSTVGVLPTIAISGWGFVQWSFFLAPSGLCPVVDLCKMDIRQVHKLTVKAGTILSHILCKLAAN